MNKLRNAPASILIVLFLVATAAVLNFVLGLLLTLTPEVLRGIDHPTTPSGAPTTLVLVAGVACIAFGFVCIWVMQEFLNKSQLALVMIYTLSGVSMIFALFRLPIGFLTIALNLLILWLVRSKSAKQWLSASQ